MDAAHGEFHGQLANLFFRLGLLLFTARWFGNLASRKGQPAVVGELLAGIVLGPTVLGAVAPELGQWVVPRSELGRHLLEFAAQLGAVFLLLITGLETDLPLIRRHARTAFGVSVGGVTTTFTSGLVLGLLLPERLLAEPDQRVVFALFIATAMSISAIPVIAKVLMDLNLMRRDVGQTIIAAGLCDDTTGWILLSLVAGLAAGGQVTGLGAALIVGKVLGFLLLSATVGYHLARRGLEIVQDCAVVRDPSLTLVLAFTFVWGSLSQALGLEAVLGAFAAGIIFGHLRRMPGTVREQLESLALGIFAPIFFASAGLKVNLLALREPTLILTALLVIAVATGGKVVGTYVGARLIGRRSHWNALVYGAGLNARGAMEIIIASVGLSLGILSQEMFSIIVLMAMVTSLMAPTALRYVLSRIEPDPDEAARLRQEELAEQSLVANLHRVLLPVRPPRGDQADSGLEALRTLEAKLIDRLAADHALEVTLLSVCAPGERRTAEPYLDRVARLFVDTRPQTRVVEDAVPMEAIGREAQRRYDLLILGASHVAGTAEVVFNPMVDALMRLGPCPTLVVRGHHQVEQWPPRKILVRATGTGAAHHAADLAFALAGAHGAEVVLLHVVVPPADAHHLDARGRDLERQLRVGHEIVDRLAELGAGRGINVDPEVRLGSAEDTVLLEVAGSREVDLIVVGSHLRPSSDKLYLGVRVERILREAPCPVLVINATR